MACGAARFADRGNVVHHARGGVDLGHQDRLDGAALVGSQARLNLGRTHGAAQFALQDFNFDAHAAGVLAPAYCEPAALQHQDLVALRKDVGQRGLPRSVPVRDVDVAMALGLEHASDIAMQALSQRQQRTRVDIDRGPVHRPEYFVRHRGRSRDGQKFPARA